MKIFVADDSTTLRERMIRLLSELSGIEVVGQAQDALVAFDAICETKPDIVTGLTTLSPKRRSLNRVSHRGYGPIQAEIVRRRVRPWV